MEALPLTVNGKLDKRALPAPEYQDVDRYRAPASAVEEILAGIYAQVLGLERVGVDDSFFDLGGDSLSAMRVIAAINTGLDAGLAVRTLFDAPTVAQLAPRIGGDGEVGVSRWWPVSGPRWFRCRLPRAGCGSSTGSRAGLRPTTCRPLFGSAGRWMSRRWARPSMMSSPATNRCAPYFPTLTVWRSSRWCRRGRGCGGAGARRWCRCRSRMWSASWWRWRDIGLICRPRSRFVRRSIRWGPSSMWWGLWCTTSLLTGGHWLRWSVMWARRIGRGGRAGPRSGRRCRCSMWITRCGSARSWVIWPMATARSPRSWGIGSRRWPGCPSGWCCPPIGPIRRWPITAAPVWRWTGRRSCSSGCGEVAREHNATSFMVVQAALAVLLSELERQFRCGGGVPDRRAR